MLKLYISLWTYLWSAEMYIANIYCGDCVGVTFNAQVASLEAVDGGGEENATWNRGPIVAGSTNNLPLVSPTTLTQNWG